MESIETTQLIFILLLTFVIGFGSLARFINLPYPIVLVIAGLLISFVPGLPPIHLNAELIFLAVLPPLLFSAAVQTSWRDFRHNIVSILLLAFGLVGFSIVGVSIAAHMLLPHFDWRLGMVLGAVVAPTDAIAATAIAKRLHLPKRIIDLLEGESLVNDASGLLALEFATSLVVDGEVPTVQYALFRFLVLTVGGIVIGVVIGKLVDLFQRKIDDPPLEITLSFVVPYVVYIAAEAADCSGVLATVAAGLYLGSRRSEAVSSAVRVESRGFWNTFTFVLNGLVFILIGLQLPFILSSIRRLSRTELLVDAAEFVVAVILLRLIWIFPGMYAAHQIRVKLLGQKEPRPSAGENFLIGWTGMRGVISLAAAISLPDFLEDGLPFPQRNVILFLTFCVIFVTLVLQGLSLPFLIRWLGLGEKEGQASTEVRVRRMMLQAGLDRISQLRDRDRGDLAPLYDDIVQVYNRRLDHLSHGDDDEDAEGARNAMQLRTRFLEISHEARNAERAKALELREKHEIDDELHTTLERELDLLDLHFQ
jgi:monovalent cation/hydrogen antiporter